MAENKSFAEKFSFPYDLLSDPAREMGLDYHACQSPDDGYAKRISYLIDRNGMVARAYETVDPATHPAQVLEDLAKLSD